MGHGNVLRQKAASRPLGCRSKQTLHPRAYRQPHGRTSRIERGRYLRFAATRFELMIADLQKVVRPSTHVGNVGQSLFDVIAAKRLDVASYCCIVPDPEFALPSPVYGGLPRTYFDVTADRGPPIRPSISVIFAEVLEHLLADDAVVMRRIRQLIAPGGQLWMSVPNALRVSNRLGVPAGRNPFPPKQKILGGTFGGYGHIREVQLSGASSPPQ